MLDRPWRTRCPQCEPVSSQEGHGAARSKTSYFFLARTPLAASSTCSTVNPYFLNKSLAGAEAPKVVIPRIAPSSPTYRSHPHTEPASTETLARTSGGRTLSRYAWVCFSNSSHDGR